MYKVRLSWDAWEMYLSFDKKDRRSRTIRKTMVEIQINPFRGAYEVPNRNEFYRYSSAHEILYTVEDQTCMIIAIRWKDRMY